MHKIVALILLLISMCLPVQASEQDIVNSFTQFTNNIVQEINDNYNQKITRVKSISQDGHAYDKRGRVYRTWENYWIKFGRGNLNYSIDIQKTNSLMNPYLGYIVASYDNLDYYSYDYPNGHFPTKEIAENSTLYNPKKCFITYRFTYAYQNSNWVLTKQEFNMDGRWGREDIPRTPFEILSMKP